MKKRKCFIFLLVGILITGLSVPAFAQMQTVIELAESAESVTQPMDSKFLENTEPLPEPKISRDKALEIAKKTLKDFFDMSVDDKNFNFNIENRRDWSNPELYVWQMSWNYNDAAEYAHVNVVLNAMTGDILEISQDEGMYAQPVKLTTITEAEAKIKAEKFIEKIIPGLLDQTVWNDNSDDYYRIMHGGPAPVFYHFNYVRLYNGVKFDNNFINVGIDGATGEIRNFSYRWDKLIDLPSKTGVISQEEAIRIMRENTTMELIYLPIRDPFRHEPIPKNVKLAYRASFNANTNMLDAKTGKMIGWNGKELEDIIKTGSLSDRQISDILAKAKPIVKKNEVISKERAQELAQLILKAEVEGVVKINNVNYVEGDAFWEAAGRKAWNIDFTVENKSENQAGMEGMMPMMNGRIMIDALTEELLGFNNWDYGPMPWGQSFEPAMTWEEAYAKAIEYIAKYHPGKINQIKADQTFMMHSEIVDGKEIPPMELFFNFPRIINGVVYDENSISISFNNRTGKLQHFTCRWQEAVNFPAPQNVITQNQAEDILMSYNDVELAYMNFNKSNDFRNPEFETKIIYRLFPKKPHFGMHMLMDATTGKPIDYSGQELPDLDFGDFDALIKDHWVERSAKLLAQQGIVEPAGFKPDEAITKIDAVKMLVKTRGMHNNFPFATKDEAEDKISFSDVREDSDDYRYIQQAIRFGIIDNKAGAFNGDAKVTREQLAVMLVKAMNYDDLAKASEIFKLDYRDQASVSKDLIGFVAISKGLDLVRAEVDNNFRPKDNATMAETADMIFKSMAHMSRGFY